jgi:hypothetical protein
MRYVISLFVGKNSLTNNKLVKNLLKSLKMPFTICFGLKWPLSGAYHAALKETAVFAIIINDINLLIVPCVCLCGWLLVPGPLMCAIQCAIHQRPILRLAEVYQSEAAKT